ncbi:hypothetical protein EI546_00710 [Aequorivita sp. H23M31]|uniref:Uncharacterized protein n=1 Tax=Aequorivita ciconiae TaxID=2494375 RepID=A0A451FSF7_9FLAO|nr:hypothetical protein [Aequorivita sp. H23M31]QAA80344.1 hypothetical protein EI546_00710 [Aequorivita sp. H23M31]
MTIKEFDEQSRQMQKELLDESISTFPRIYSLNRVGEQLMKFVIQLKAEKTELNTILHSLYMDLDIFLADLGGQLQQDYDRKNKRYKRKWSLENRKINDFIFQLKAYISENESE